MRDIKRIKRLLNKLAKLWAESPDERFGQFLINRRLVSDDMRIWIREDDETEAIIDEWLGKKEKADK